MRETQEILTVLRQRVGIWPPGTRVNIVEPFGTGLLIEVPAPGGGTLDILAVRHEALTVTD